MANEQEKVCVTGASGFLASWLVKRLLQDGYHVVGTVRDPENSSKTSHLWELPGAQQRLELRNADLLNEGAFDDIVQGCSGVFHVAAAVTFHYKQDPQVEIVDPCVRGTLNVLNACKKSKTVKRVVCTSSTAAVRFRDDSTEKDILDESDWSSPDYCLDMKIWYGLAKTQSEQAALDFGKSNNLDVITIAPGAIAGELLSSTVTSTATDFLSLFKGANANMWCDYLGYVHLDDVASAHILVYKHPNASGRYICSAVNTTATDFIPFVANRYPKYKISTEVKVLYPAKFKGFNSRKLEHLGLRFKSLEEMLDDCVHGFERQGLL